MLWCYGVAARDVATLQHCGGVICGNGRQQRTMQRWRAALVMVGSALQQWQVTVIEIFVFC